jgi:hypothetical protein
MQTEDTGMQWYVSNEGSEPLGPLATDLVERGILAGKVPVTSLVCAVGDSRWMPLAAVPEFAEALREVAPPPDATPPPPPLPPPDTVQGASWWVRYPNQQAMGPYPGAAVLERLQSGVLLPTVEVCRVGDSAWTPAAQELGFAAAVLPTPQVEASFDPNPNAEHSATSGSPQGALKVAVFLTGLTALFWLGIVLIQCVLFIATQKSETAMLALWNSLIVAMNVWIATALWRRKPVGYSWGLGTHSLNALLGVYQVFSGAPLLILVVPLHAISAVAIWRSHAQFPTPTPAQGQQAPGFSFKRVLIAVGGFVVTIITVSLIVIMLNN